MGWGRTLLLGDIGNRLDIQDTEEQINLLYDDLKDIDRINLEQDERLAKLEQENQELKLYVASLIRLLVSKGALAPSEVETIVNGIEPDK